MKSFIEKQIREIDTDYPDPVMLGDDLRQMLKDVELKATAEGFPEIVKACQIRSGPISISIARLVLSQCLAIANGEKPKDWLLVSEVAELLRVSDSKVLDWIKSGRLKSKNLSDSTRPQYRVHADSLKEFDDVSPETKPRRRRASTKPKDYFPDK